MEVGRVVAGMYYRERGSKGCGRVEQRRRERRSMDMSG
jgi:hypothetical protein